MRNIVSPSALDLLNRDALSEIEEDIEEYFSRGLSNEHVRTHQLTVEASQSIISKGKKKGKKAKKKSSKSNSRELSKYKAVFKRAYMKYKIRLNLVHYRQVIARMVKLGKFRSKRKTES
jgi:hypothetical protein